MNKAVASIAGFFTAAAIYISNPSADTLWAALAICALSAAISMRCP